MHQFPDLHVFHPGNRYMLCRSRDYPRICVFPCASWLLRVILRTDPASLRALSVARGRRPRPPRERVRAFAPGVHTWVQGFCGRQARGGRGDDATKKKRGCWPAHRIGVRTHCVHAASSRLYFPTVRTVCVSRRGTLTTWALPKVVRQHVFPRPRRSRARSTPISSGVLARLLARRPAGRESTSSSGRG